MVAAGPQAPVYHQLALGGGAKLVAATVVPRRSLRASTAVPKVLAVSAPQAAPAPAAVCRSSATPPALAKFDGAGPITLAGRRFQALRPLGRGAFGEVWEAQELSGGGGGADGGPQSPPPAVALKCSSPQNQDGLDACLLEAEVLELLSAALPPPPADGGVPSAGRVPRYVAHGRGHGGGHGQVLIAMSKLEGCPLDQWLYGVDESCLKTLPVATLLDGPLPAGRTATRDLRSACATAEALLRQTVPVFTQLAPIAFHRDVSGHNFLVHEGPEGHAVEEQFAILDFGLAVRSPGWQQEWRRRNIAGDPRYFTPAAWMLLTHGHRHLDAQPDRDFARQYEHRIDHFSLGVLLCEVLFALWRGPAAEASVGEERPRGREALAAARAAWRTYWSRVVGFFQKFHAEGALALRGDISRTGAIQQLVGELGALCAALRAAAAAAEGGAERRVLQAAAGLLDWHSSLSWEGLAALLRSCEEGAVRKAATAPASDGATAQAPAVAAGSPGATPPLGTPPRQARDARSPPRPSKAPARGVEGSPLTPRALFQSPGPARPASPGARTPPWTRLAESAPPTAPSVTLPAPVPVAGGSDVQQAPPPRRPWYCRDEERGAKEAALGRARPFVDALRSVALTSLGSPVQEAKGSCQDAALGLARAAAEICASPRRAAPPSVPRAACPKSPTKQHRASRYCRLQEAAARAAANPSRATVLLGGSGALPHPESSN